MKLKTLLTIAFTLCVAVMSAKDIKELRLTTEPPMHCASCENNIKKALRFEKGVKDITTDVAAQCVTISYDAEKTTPEKLEAALKKGGYESRPYGACQGEEQQCKKTACTAATDCKKATCEKKTDCKKAECQKADCKKTECQKVDCKKADCKKTECKKTECQKVDCKKTECQKADCKKADCKKADCKKTECKKVDCKKAECKKADCKKADCKKAECKKQ